MRSLPLLAACLALADGQAASPAPPLHSTPVLVTAKGYGSASVRTPAGGLCTLTWDATADGSGAAAAASAAAAAEAAAAQAQGAPSAAAARAAVAALHGVAYAATGADGFTYEVVLGPSGGAWQRAAGGDAKYSLGKPAAAAAAAAADPSVVLFVGGDSCGALPRSATVRLYCGEAAGIARTEEPSTCAYALALTHPSLCKLTPPFAQLPAPAAWGGDGGGALPALPPRVVLRGKEGLLAAVPSALRAALAGLQGAAGELPAAPAQQAAAAAAASALTTEDVEGTGGRSLGVDDSERHGARWVGLGDPGAAGEAVSAWVLEARASALAPGQWLCSAYAADDLRKGTGGGGSGGVVLRSATLEAAGGAGLGLLRAVTRGVNRQEVGGGEGAGVRVVGGGGGGSGGGALQLQWQQRQDLPGAEGELAFISLVVGEQQA